MIDGKRILAVIPARGGSKGIPRKNVTLVGGKPLIAWTIEEAKKSRYIDSLILSSEDEEIIRVAKSFGCEVPFVRPQSLSRDETPGIDPVLHAIKELPGFDYLILLQPTSPFRQVSDIDACLERCIQKNAPACVSVTETDKSPYWMYELDSQGLMSPVIKSDKLIARRQDLPQSFVLNGAVYVARCDWLLQTLTFVTPETVGYVMPKERSLDVDTEFDLKILKLLWENSL
jgi:CMP-N,N'-diacetyllegionaminic acid synthase